MQEYKAKGYLNFVMVSDGGTYKYAEFILTKEEALSEITNYSADLGYKKAMEEMIDDKFTSVIDFDLISGIDFLNDVLSGCISNYDGFINRIYVDGYISNLGLFTGTFSDGEFLVDEETFRQICQEHKVEVDWANK